MNSQANSRAKSVALLAIVAVIVAACGLPRVGPTKKEIYAGSVQREGDAFVVSVNDRVTRATAVTPALGAEQVVEAERDQRGDAAVGDQHDVAAAPAVAAPS